MRKMTNFGLISSLPYKCVRRVAMEPFRSLEYLIVAGFMFIVLQLIFTQQGYRLLLPSRTIAEVLSCISLATLIITLLIVLKLAYALKHISGKLKEISEADSPGGRVDLKPACVLLPLVTLADNINKLLDKLEQKDMQINELKHLIEEQEEKNALLWLEIEHNLCVAKEDAETDPLTGLFNRKGMQEKFDAELAKAKKSGTALSVLMADLDHFKRVNDNFGHQIGDEVLKLFAELLNDTIRLSDIAVRYGGEEFLIILPATSGEKGVQIAKRINEALPEFIANRLKDVENLKCTVSIGVADYPACAQDKNMLIEAADQALYEAKQSGRNSVVYFSGADNSGNSDIKPLSA